MSEKDTSQKEAPQKIMTKYDRKLQKRKEEELKAKKKKKIDMMIGIILLAAIIIGLASIPVRKHIATNSTYITVGEHEITKVEFDYYYNLASSSYIDNYGMYLSYMGLDINSDFASQSYNDTMTWKDYFAQLAVDSILQNKALLDAAKAASFTHDTAEEYASFENSAKEAAEKAGVSLGKYYKATFGTYATPASIKPFVEEEYTAAAYYRTVSEANKVSAEDIKAYYDENKSNYDSVDYLLTEITANVPEAQTVTGEDGEDTKVEPTEEEVKTAMDAAKKEADAALLVLDEEGTQKLGMLKSSVSNKYNAWLYDEARVAGDTTIIEDTDNHKYYVLKFENRYLDETPTATIRAIMLAPEVSGDTVLEELKAAGGTEDAFIDLVKKYSVDSYTNTGGGKYNELAKSTLNTTMSDWIFAEGRKAGDTVSVTEEGYTYVLYYIEAGRPEWQTKIASTLLSQFMNDYVKELKSALEISDPNGHLVYLKAQEVQNTEADNTETQNTEANNTETGNTETAAP